MEKGLKFNSQVCTNLEQSKKLLGLGLKPETADMYIFDDEVYIGKPNVDDIPAWSLHRLVQLMPPYLHFDKYADTRYYLTLKPSCLTKVLYRQDNGGWIYGSESSNNYDAIIDVIKYLIKANHFNKEYLKQ